MDDFRLRVFVTAARTLNFSKCAQQLGVSQPAVSNHIKELESGYGVKLFERTVSGLVLTPVGKILLDRSEKILSGYAGLACEMQVAGSARKLREMRIVASENFSRYVLPEVVARFMQLASGVSVTVRTATNAEVENFLEIGAADLGFVEKTEAENDWHFDYEEIAEDEVVLVAGRDVAAKHETMSLEGLMVQRLVMNKQDVDLMEDLDHALVKCGCSLNKLNVAMRLESTEAVKRIVAQGDMMAFVSGASVTRKLAAGELRIVGVEGLEPVVRRFAGVSVRGQMDAAKKAFCHLVREMLPDGTVR